MTTSRSPRAFWSVLLCCLSSLALACGGDDDDDSGGGDANVDIAVCAPDHGPFTAEVDNPYFPLVVGAVHVLEGLEGGTEMARFQIEVMDETVEVAGVTARVVEKLDLLDDAAVPEREFFAQAPDGTACIYGEEGEWEAGQDGYLAAVFMPGAPEVGMIFESIHGPDGVETGEITFLGVPTDTPAGTFEDTLTVLEDGPSLKKYARGIGEIYDDGIELISY